MRTPVTPRSALLAITLLVAVSLTSCGSFRRLGKDITFGTAGLVVMPIYGGAVDGYDSSRGIRGGLQEDSRVEVITLPFTFLYHGLKHLVYCGAHTVDIFLFPIYGVAELSGLSGDVEPLDIYTNTIFDKQPDSSTDAESGEVVGR